LIPELLGSESFYEATDGSIFTGLADGRVVRLDPIDGSVEDVVRLGDDDDECGTVSLQHKCGRPLGMAANPMNRLEELLVCDGANATRGVMIVNFVRKTKRSLLNEVEGVPLTFCNSIASMSKGLVLISHSSSSRGVTDFLKEFITAKPSGRVVSLDMRSGKTSVVVSDVSFTNGIVILPGGQSVLYSDLGRGNVMELRSVVDGQTVEDAILTQQPIVNLVFKTLPVVIDNLKINPENGNVLIGAPADLRPALILKMTRIGEIFKLLPDGILEKLFTLKPSDSKIVELDVINNKVLSVYIDRTETISSVSEGFVPNHPDSKFFGRMFIGSVNPTVPLAIVPFDRTNNNQSPPVRTVVVEQ